MTRHRLLLTCASGLALSTGAALAQTAAAPPPSSEDSVEAVVVTASRSGDALSADLIGASATAITRVQLDQRQTRAVSDVLRDVPGVAVSRSGPVGALTQVRIRGAEGNHTLVLIDGVKASDPYSGEYDFGTLIADEDARVEVLRGQQSSLYGSDAIGGVIQYFTLTGAQAPGAKLRVGGGSQGTFEAAARTAGVSGDFDYAFSASTFRTDGYPTAVGGSRDVGSDSLGASAKVIWAPRTNIHLTGVARYSRTDADLNDTDGIFGSPTFGRIVDSPGARFVNEGLYGLLRGQVDSLGGRWTNAVTAQVADTTRVGYGVADVYSPPARQPIDKVSGDHGQRFRGSFESALRFGDERLQHRMTFAVDGERERERTTVSLYGAFLGWRETTNVGIVGEYELASGDRWAVGGSVRQDLNDRFADSTTYRVQGSYKLPYGLRAHAAAGSGVKAPSFSELYDYYVGRFIGNANLKPETSEGWEAGLEETTPDGRFSLGATYFDNRLRDEIATTYTAAGATPYNMDGQTRQRGVEVSAVARLGSDWRLDLSYTYLDAPQDRFVILGGVAQAYTGQAVRRAQTIASANLTWAPAQRPYAATLTVRYNGEQGDLAFTDPSYVPLLVRLHDFTLVNLGGTYRLTPRLELYGRVENLLDQDYQEVFSIAASGVTGYGGARVRF